MDAHYFGGCPLIHKYWSKIIFFICNQILKNNHFSLSIFMHIMVLNQIWKKVVNKLSFNLISFKMQEFITNFHCYNYFQWKMVPYFQLISCLELFPSIPNAYIGWPIDLFAFSNTHFHVLDFFVSSSHCHFCAKLVTMLRSLWGN